MKSMALGSLLAFSLAACASFPPPSERLAQAESGTRAAREIGAADEPAAALFLKMANDQVNEARKLMASGDNEHADAVLMRAQSDAELALQLAREARAKADAAAVLAKINGAQAASRGGAQ